MKSFLRNNNIDMYSMQNGGKYVVAEIFIRTFKNKICRYMTSVSKNVYIDKLDDIVNKHNNTSKKVKNTSKTLVKELKTLRREHMLISDLNRKEIVRTFYEKELQKK